ncbi:MurR/RpiR family transcriptional regulator [Gordonia jinhuaensis]|uniref:Regulatory protein n=1 Tax=Gordonia jinhuaensis TaxID=1517702 RepID=A0A916WPD1_9ACTN|nr:MurR/RpiR family transcriptional regulator [Gordonia jinhuaensis]GGB19926.1 regulatory protein [Gordonia jinhuaensis]
MAHVRAMAPSLLPTEQAVAAVLLTNADHVIDMSSQQVADRAGASRATVVRACQSLGFTGYQQLRVLLARDAGMTAVAAEPSGQGPAATVRATFDHVAASMQSMTALLDDDDVERTVELLVGASSVVVIGNGLSTAVAADFAARLMSRGIHVMAPADVITQHVTVGVVDHHDVVVVFSGSGASTPSIRAAELATRAGATVIAVTAFSHSPLATAADITLVVGIADFSFRDEVTVTSRIPQFILLEGLVAAVSARLGESAERRRTATLEVISDYLIDEG